MSNSQQEKDVPKQDYSLLVSEGAEERMAQFEALTVEMRDSIAGLEVV
jgi:hypothetical protein